MIVERLPANHYSLSSFASTEMKCDLINVNCLCVCRCIAYFAQKKREKKTSDKKQFKFIIIYEMCSWCRAINHWIILRIVNTHTHILTPLTLNFAWDTALPHNNFIYGLIKLFKFSLECGWTLFVLSTRQAITAHSNCVLFSFWATIFRLRNCNKEVHLCTMNQWCYHWTLTKISLSSCKREKKVEEFTI